MISLELYRKGFIIYPADTGEFVKPDSYVTKKINEVFCISHDSGYPVSVVEEDGVYCVVIGVVLDTKSFKLDRKFISENILNMIGGDVDSAFKNEHFLDYLDYLNGRYCIVLIKNDSMYVTNDASGMRTVFYHDSLNIIASHYNLLNEVAKESQHPLVDIYKTQKERYVRAKWFSPFGLPGNITFYNHIYQLVCNHFYDLKQHKQVRFWPRDKNYEFDVRQAVTYISQTIKKTESVLADNFEVYQSLTMGNDSRMSLAAARDSKDKIVFFTYNNNQFPEADSQYNCIFASLAAKQLGLHHVLIDSTNDLTDSESELLLKNNYRQHHKGIISGFRKTFKNLDPNKAMHIRTNITEVMRQSYYNIPKRVSLDELAAKMAHWSSYPPKYKEDFEVIKQYYLTYIKDMDFTNVFKFDYGDIFYLEYRMNQWHSAVVQNQDFIFDTFILFNTRKILEYGMLIPKQLKDSNIFVDEIQRVLWPELLQLKHPNITKNSEELVDWFSFNSSRNFLFYSDPFHDKIYNIKSGNLKQPKVKYLPVYEKPNLEGIVFGFSNNVLRAGDYVDLEIPVWLGKSSYYLDVTVFCLWSMLSDYTQVSYELYIDDKRIYNLSTNVFARDNQICYMFKNFTERNALIKIRLLSNINCSFKNFNGVIDIKHMTLMRIPEINDDEKVFSSYEQYKSMLKQ